MAHFYAEIQGNRGTVTRMGTKSSGLTCHIRGWDIGARVDMDVNPETGEDRVTVYRTAGSKYSGSEVEVYCETLAPRGGSDDS